ncbi:MAG: YfiH family protein [Cellvibrionaceae bacterium]|jgi:YfiH family protein
MSQSKMLDHKQGFIIPDWPAPENVQALVSTRVSLNSVSKLPKIVKGYDYFNLALHVNDDPQHVLKNREKLAQHLKVPSTNIAWLEQVHGTEVVNTEDYINNLVRADACTSTRPKNVCAIMTADCLPVLFCNIPEPENNEAQQVAAAHAGWRGLADGILSKTLAGFPQSDTVIAWLGPAISQTHFEVGQEVYDVFVDKNSVNKKAFIISPNSSIECPKWLASLTELAKIELDDAGIKAIYGGDQCTYGQAELFYSYRRDGEQSGRMASLILLT